ncbi:unnamed protein product, partial [Gongylonema pulchrum]|uniref:NPC1_N domain-containing protein n=1 Tax=Gongylonema pulchrum TaxID=637853 RepID=A0A183ESN2_9BILA
ILFHEAFHEKYRVITRLTKGCPADSDFCPLDVFMKRSKAFLPVDIKKDCLPTKTNDEFIRKCNSSVFQSQ